MRWYEDKFKTPCGIETIIVRGLKGAYLINNVGGRLQAVTWPGLQKWEWNHEKKEWEVKNDCS